jgi:membrane-associated phospholipid phosphatase
MAVILPVLIWIFAPLRGIILIQLICISEILNALLKWTVQRPRPFWINPRVRNVGGLFEGDYSFPSSHSQLVAAICYFMQPEHPLASIGLWAWAFCTGISRVYAGVHFVSDVIVGWCTGLGLAWLFHTVDAELQLRHLSHHHEVYTICLGMLTIIYVSLALVRSIFPPHDSKQIQKWEEIVRNASKRNRHKSIRPRLLSKYSFIIWAQIGVILGYYYSYHDTMDFPHETCFGSLETWIVALARYIFGVVGILCVVPIAIVKIPGWNTADVQMAFVSLLLGLWVAYGNAKVSTDYLGLHCPKSQ